MRQITGKFRTASVASIASIASIASVNSSIKFANTDDPALLMS